MEEQQVHTKYRAFENFHVVLWLIKDFCWCMLWKPLAVFMIAPTFAFAVFLCYSSKAQRSDFFHNLAVLLWIMANSIWMIGEFYFQDGLKMPALLCFLSGLIVVGYFYLSSFIEAKMK